MNDESSFKFDEKLILKTYRFIKKYRHYIIIFFVGFILGFIL